MMSENSHHHAAQYAELPTEERQIEATLAIAYEQRTANLIALAILQTSVVSPQVEAIQSRLDLL